MQGLLLADSSEKMDSMNLLLYMAPIAALLLVPAIMISEPTVLSVAREQAYADHSELFTRAVLIRCCCCLVFGRRPSCIADPWYLDLQGSCQRWL